jgi:hypothetical protein
VEAIWRDVGDDLRCEERWATQGALVCSCVSLIIKLVWVKVEVVLRGGRLTTVRSHEVQGTRYDNRTIADVTLTGTCTTLAQNE